MTKCSEISVKNVFFANLCLESNIVNHISPIICITSSNSYLG